MPIRAVRWFFLGWRRDPAPAAMARSYRPFSSGPPPEPAARELRGESLFGVHPLRLFNDKDGCHLIDPRRYPASQGPFDGKLRRMPRLARREFGRLLFRPLLGGRKLRLERFDMGFERSDNLIGQRSFIWIAEVLSAAINPSGVVPTLRGPNPSSLVVAKRLLPTAALRPLPN